MNEKVLGSGGVTELWGKTKERSVPPGGASGQILAKQTQEDFDAHWIDPAGGAPFGLDQLRAVKCMIFSESGTFKAPKAVGQKFMVLCQGGGGGGGNSGRSGICGPYT